MNESKLNHDDPSQMEARYINEVKKMTPQQRYEKLMAIIQLSYILKTAKQKSI
ncbi:hypothetical protein [Flavobacterium ammonificans]|uniref:Uncharacterized protein n=1 Tax=Flavobacterium ammonificans TaxID=1751056 RepID=A0ABN6KWR3_9FLAO|nr:hypothetical protein [Flavobacterium ammonificans]BDB53606.1 hypothetical protein GENT11_19180 [Flavobacterium ammonificans]